MRFIAWVIVFSGLDLLSKYLALVYLSANPLKITDFFSFQLSYNDRLAFSLPFPLLATIILSLFLLFALGIYFYRARPLDKLHFWGGVLIFGGAIANLAERIMLGRVIDFIDFSFWPSFNLADSFICVGVFLLVLLSFEKKEKIGNNINK